MQRRDEEDSMIVTMDKILKKAKNGRYGIAAPDAYSSTSVMACFQAAVNQKAPLIISCLGTTNMEETADNNILINKVNRDMTREEMAKIVIQNLGNNPIFKQKIDELKEKIKQ